MYYYAYLNDEDICTSIYELPAQISGSQFIAIPDNYQFLVGQHYNRTTQEFEVLYYYAVLDSRAVVTETVYYYQQQQTSETLRSITFQQYQTITGLYWNGTEYVTPPISVLAIASTDEVNYKDEDKWLSVHLDEMQADIDSNMDDIATITTNLATVVSNLTSVSENLASLTTAVAGKANAVHTHSIDDVSNLAGTISSIQTSLDGKANTAHTHTADSLSGVVKTINGNVPDASGNIVVTSGGMTADEILTAIKTVDGSGSGLDADKLDGLEATAFAAANHNHDAAYAPKDHTHAAYATRTELDEYALVESLEDYATTSAMNTALAGKSDTTHNHDAVYAPIAHNHNTVYAPIAHTHTMENVTGLATALAGKSNTDHNHNTAYASISHSHEIDNVTGLSTALAGKSDITHNHDTAYAAIDHTHTGYATTASVTALETTVSGLENDVSGKADAVHSHSQNDVTGLAAALNGKANTSHTHAISDVTGLQTTLNGKAASSHTHSDYLPTTGGTVSGNLNVNGIVRVNNQQCLFDSGSMVTVSTNNRETMIAGSKIYSKVAISVSSDARLKENVQPAPMEDLVSMIKRLEVKKFNYKGNAENNIGIIAQDFIYNNPTYISDIYIRQCCDDGMYSFKETELVYALVAAVQDIYNRLEN